MGLTEGEEGSGQTGEDAAGRVASGTGEAT